MKRPTYPKSHEWSQYTLADEIKHSMAARTVVWWPYRVFMRANIPQIIDCRDGTIVREFPQKNQMKAQKRAAKWRAYLNEKYWESQ